MRLWLKAQEKCGPTRSARRRDPTRRRALPPRRRALPPPPSGPAAATLRGGVRLELLADGRLQRARFRRLRTPTRGICRRVTGVSVRRPAASRPAGSRTSFCTSPSLSTTASRSPFASSTLNVSSCFQRHAQWRRLRWSGGYEGRLYSGRSDPSASRPARSRPAPPLCRAPPRPVPPVICMSEFCIRQVRFTLD